MIAFHFTRDLALFGLIAPGTTLSGRWALASRLIAGTFLFLSGTSMVLAAMGVMALWWKWGRALDLPGWLDWTGLAVDPRQALDLIPAIPSLAPVFLGMACAQLFPFPTSCGRHWRADLARAAQSPRLPRAPAAFDRAIWLGLKGLSE